ncbi:MAG: UDP-N-acetylglucosamine--LPS N-acetylglucosamine transferase [Pseudomonadota bacterium]
MSSEKTSLQIRVMAIASGGGHWVELRRLRPAWQGCEIHYVTTEPGYGIELEAEPEAGFHVIPDANRWQKLRLLWQLLTLIWLMLRLRPQAVVSTGAAPGYFALRLGRLIGARTIWIDSIANAEELSLSGRIAGRHADLWLTQWPHLTGAAGAEAGRGPEYRGAVM